MSINASEFKARRSKLFDQMQPNSIAVLSTAPHYYRSADQDHTFFADPDFYYLTGFTEPEAIAVLIKTDHDTQYVLFNRVRDRSAEQWTGFRAGQQGAVDIYGADASYPINEFTSKLPELLAGKEVLYYTLGRYSHIDDLLKQVMNSVRRQIRLGLKIPDVILNLENLTFEMRLFKSDYELEMIQKAVDISVDAHLRAMHFIAPGKTEHQIHAELMHEFMRQGGRGEAYESIVASGDNACILHYVENRSTLKENDLLLIDAGANYQFYCGDITRTTPVSGRFTGEQKAIYDIVLAAQIAAIESIKPGKPWDVMHDVSLKILTQGLVDIGLLKGNVDDLIQQNAYKPFYMHRIGHWLGIDVHDTSPYKINGQWRNFEPRMVTTVEPGIYISRDLDVDDRWKGIGIRIEDNIAVTEQGCHVLSQRLPKTIDEIESIKR